MKRRPNGMGTVYLRKDSRYEAAGYVTLQNRKRRRISAYGPTATEALRKFNDKLKMIELNKETTRSNDQIVTIRS